MPNRNIPKCASSHCNQQRTGHSEYCGKCERDMQTDQEAESRRIEFESLSTDIHFNRVSGGQISRALDLLWEEIQSLKENS